MRQADRRATAGARERRTRGALVAAEVALSLVLLVAAGLMLRTLGALLATDPGFRPGGVLAVELDPPFPRYDETPEVASLWAAAEQRLGALPGVAAAGAINLLPMAGGFDGNGITVVGRPQPPPGEELSAETRLVSPGFAAAAGVPVRRGRWFTARDAGAPLAVVDELLAARAFPGEDPLGQRLVVRGTTYAVVGVAAAVRHRALALPPEPTLYLSWEAGLDSFGGTGYLLLRTPGDPSALAAAARAALREVAPDLPAGDVRALREVVTASAGKSRLQAALLACFAAMAVAIGAVGIYAVVASAAAARRRELSLRAALGARRRQLLRLALAQGMTPVAAGLAVGLAGAWAASRLLAGLLYGVAPTDAATFAAAPGLLLAVALLACWLPARRAAAADPALALRGDG
jgi:predicted permease